MVSQEYPPGPVGGIGTQTEVKARGLADMGYTVELLTPGDEGLRRTSASRAGDVTVHRFPPVGADFPVYRPEAYWLGHSWQVLAAIRRLRQAGTRFDIVDFPDYGAEGLAFLLDRDEAERMPAVVHLHGSLTMLTQKIGWPERGSSFARIGGFMEDACLRLADGWMAASASVADFAARAHGIPAERIEIVYAGVDARKFRPDTSPHGELPPHVLFVGNVALNKGLRTVFETFLRLRASFGDLRLTIAGEGDEGLLEEMEVEAARHGAGEALEVLGFVEQDDLPALYRRALVVAAPSQYEGGLGMVYLEAMACGRPVIAGRAGGAPEAVVDGETGFLVPPDDVEATERAIHTLLTDGDLRQRMGEAARRRVDERFTTEQYARRVSRAYARVLESGRSAGA